MNKKTSCLGSLIKIVCFLNVLVAAWYFVDVKLNPTEVSAKSAISSSYTEKIKNGKEESKSTSEVDIPEPDFELSDVYYYYTQLSGDELKIYKLMYQGMNSHEESILLPADIENRLRPIYDMVRNDHPELFWVENSFRYYNYNDRTVLLPNYNRTKEESEEIEWEIYTALHNFRGTLSEEDFDYDVLRKAYLYIIDTVDYVDGASDNQNLISALVNGQSVCAGYARAYQYLLQKSGIQSVYVHGNSLNDDGWGSHAWNIVRCGDEYYHIDTTYGDDIEDENMLSLGIHDYSYFCVDDASIGRDHKISDTLPVPECSSLGLNYYAINGRYFDYYDDSVVSSIYNSVYNGEYYWSCQFSNYDAYAACLADISVENGLYARAVSEYICDVSYTYYNYYNNTYTIICYY